MSLTVTYVTADILRSLAVTALLASVLCEQTIAEQFSVFIKLPSEVKKCHKSSLYVALIVLKNR